MKFHFLVSGVEGGSEPAAHPGSNTHDRISSAVPGIIDVEFSMGQSSEKLV